MNHHLKVQLDHDDDGTAGIVAEVKSNGFSGKGEAWFNLSEIKAFASQLEAFAKTLNNPPIIEGGLWNEEGGLTEKLLSQRLYPISNHRIGMQVILADYPYTDSRPEEISRLSLELKPEAQATIEFARQLVRLVTEKSGVAILECR
ncbi:MAG: hypothetical protein KDG52_01880 [Rhodocyclaceae bacterium]|nr:hypothetical protein [Rhodocyclaceae bacterium]